MFVNFQQVTFLQEIKVEMLKKSLEKILYKVKISLCCILTFHMVRIQNFVVPSSHPLTGNVDSQTKLILATFLCWFGGKCNEVLLLLDFHLSSSDHLL